MVENGRHNAEKMERERKRNRERDGRKVKRGEKNEISRLFSNSRLMLARGKE